MDIGENIRKIRTWKGIPQKEVSASTRIPQGTLSKIEAGQDFLWSRLQKIAVALQVDVKDIVCFDTNKVTFNMLGDKAKGVVINQNNEQLMQVNQMLQEENKFLKKMLEKALNNKQTKK